LQTYGLHASGSELEGTIVFEDGNLTGEYQAGFEIGIKNVLSTNNFDGYRSYSPSENPEGSFDVLPIMYHGTYFWAVREPEEGMTENHPKMEADPVLVINGVRSDAAIHYSMLNNPETSRRADESAVRMAVEMGLFDEATARRIFCGPLDVEDLSAANRQIAGTVYGEWTSGGNSGKFWKLP